MAFKGDDDIWYELEWQDLLIFSCLQTAIPNSYSVSQEGTIFGGKSTGNVAKRSAFNSWLLHRYCVTLLSHDLPLTILSSEKLSLVGYSSLVISIAATFFFPFITDSLCYFLFHLLFPSLECKLLEDRALPILTSQHLVHCMAHGWCSIFTIWMNGASHLSTLRLSFFLLLRMGIIIPISWVRYEA